MEHYVIIYIACALRLPSTTSFLWEQRQNRHANSYMHDVATYTFLFTFHPTRPLSPPWSRWLLKRQVCVNFFESENISVGWWISPNTTATARWIFQLFPSGIDSSTGCAHWFSKRLLAAAYRRIKILSLDYIALLPKMTVLFFPLLSAGMLRTWLKTWMRPWWK